MAVERSARRASARPEATVRRPTIAIIGAGRMGTALGRALALCGYTIEAVVAQHKAHASRASALIDPRPSALSSAQLDRLPLTDILLITTPDDSIENVASKLALLAKSQLEASRRKGLNAPARLTALHASGARSSEALRSLRAAGFATGSMHPLVSVSNAVHGAESLCSAYFCVEGDRHAERVARRLVRDLGGQSFSIKTEDKALYHAAAVMASGHVTALFDIATELLTKCGLSARQARTVFLPLLKSTTQNLYNTDPARALTGTFARGDTATVRRHLRVLRSTDMQDACAAYALLGLRSLELARRAGARLDALDEIASLLKQSEE